MKNSLLILGITLLSFLLSSCSSPPQQPLDYEQIADQITAETGRQLKKEKGLVLIGTGGGMMYDIQMMAMSFNFYQEVSIEKARKLLVYTAEKYLKNINANKEVRPYLHDNPFTEKNIEIAIFFHKKDGCDVSKDCLSIVSTRKGEVDYYSVSGK